MSEIVKHKGKFIRGETLKKRLKAVQAMNEAGKPKKIQENCELYKEEVTRVVNLTYMRRYTNCLKCNSKLSLLKIVDTIDNGLHSTFKIAYDDCSFMKLVPSGSRHLAANGSKHYDINTKLALGIIHNGVNYSAIATIAACLNIPFLSWNTYKEHEREVGPLIEETAKEYCLRATDEEKELVINHTEKLCADLPKEIAKDVYPEVFKCNSAHVGRSENPDEGTNVVASYDMRWRTRGNARSYDSYNGSGAIIGKMSGKVLDFATRNRKCNACDHGSPKGQHDCRKNHEGFAKSMEAQDGNDLVNFSSFLKEKKLNVRVVMGDEDSSAFAAMKMNSPFKLYKLADRNHFKKNIRKQLYQFGQKYLELKNSKSVDHILKCISYANSQNVDNTDNLADTLRSIPNYLYGSYENSDEWCSRNNGEQQLKEHTVLFKNK